MKTFREVLAEVNRAEVMVLHDLLLYREKQFYPRRSRSLRFPYQDYDRYENHRPALGKMRFSPVGYPVEFSGPIGYPIEIERIIAPFFDIPALLFWAERGQLYERRLWSPLSDKKLVTSIQGRLYGWGWPLYGQIVQTMTGTIWIPLNKGEMPHWRSDVRTA